MPGKFRYYITDTMEGRVVGTNDQSTAESYASCEDYYVVDTETGEWILAGDDGSIERRSISDVANPDQLTTH